MEKPSAFAGLRRLFSSSKYLLALLATGVVVALLYSGRLDVSQGSWLIAVIITAAMGATALEDAADKTNRLKITPTPELVQALGDVISLFLPKTHKGPDSSDAPTLDPLALERGEVQRYVSAALYLLKNLGKLPPSGNVTVRELCALLDEHFTPDQLNESLSDESVQVHVQARGGRKIDTPLDA